MGLGAGGEERDLQELGQQPQPQGQGRRRQGVQTEAATSLLMTPGEHRAGDWEGGGPVPLDKRTSPQCKQGMVSQLENDIHVLRTTPMASFSENTKSKVFSCLEKKEQPRLQLKLK